MKSKTFDWKEKLACFEFKEKKQWAKLIGEKEIESSVE
jgi:hypothetical protein